MKKFFTLIISVISLSSCNDFIDLKPLSQSTADGFYNDEYEMQQGLAAAYSELQSTNQYGGIGFASFMEVSADNTWNLGKY